jgi:transposase InsO family protein
MRAARRRVSSITAIAASSTFRSTTLNAWAKPASNHQWEVLATRTTTHSPSPSLVSTRPKLIHRRGPWRHFEAVEFRTLEWVDWFNNQRLLEPIGNMPPLEFEMMYYQKQEENETVAGVN